MTAGLLAREAFFAIKDPSDPLKFVALCAMQNISIEQTTNTIDTSVPPCGDRGAPITKTSRPGMKELAIECDGKFREDERFQAVMASVSNDTPIDGEVIISDKRKITCAEGWYITKISRGGGQEDELTLALSFVPAGAFVETYTP